MLKRKKDIAKRNKAYTNLLIPSQRFLQTLSFLSAPFPLLLLFAPLPNSSVALIFSFVSANSISKANQATKYFLHTCTIFFKKTYSSSTSSSLLKGSCTIVLSVCTYECQNTCAKQIFTHLILRKGFQTFPPHLLQFSELHSRLERFDQYQEHVKVRRQLCVQESYQ